MGFKLGLQGLLLGPRECNVVLLNHVLNTQSTRGMFGAVTSFKHTWALSLVLLGRKDGDIEAIKTTYHTRYGDTLLDRIKDVFRRDTLLGNLYMNVLECTPRPGVSEVPEALKKATQADIDKDADALFTATVGAVEAERFAWIFTTSTSARLREVAEVFGKKQGTSLAGVVERKLKKTEALKEELMYILRGLDDRPKRDAELLEATMKGFGMYFPWEAGVMKADGRDRYEGYAACIPRARGGVG